MKIANNKANETEIKIEGLESFIEELKKKELVIVGGRPGAGKTKLAVSLASELSRRNKKVILFSLEMGYETIIKRFNGKKRNDDSIIVDCSSGIAAADIESKIQSAGQVDCIIIDYLGLISSSAEHLCRSDEIEGIITGLKELAINQNVSVICCAQVSRSSEGKPVFGEPESILNGSDKVITLERSESVIRINNQFRPESHGTKLQHG